MKKRCENVYIIKNGMLEILINSNYFPDVYYVE